MIIKQNNMNHQKLPDGYAQVKTIDLQGNVKIVFIIHITVILVMAVMTLLALIFVPFPDNTETVFYFKMLVAILGSFLYVFLHELTHGAFFELFSGKRSKYGMSFLYAFTKSEIYYDKRCYRIVALAPLILWSFVLIFIIALIPASWFWAVYIIEVFNVASSVGDIYVVIKTRKLHKDALFFDEGYKMQVFAPAPPPPPPATEKK